MVHNAALWDKYIKHRNQRCVKSHIYEMFIGRARYVNKGPLSTSESKIGHQPVITYLDLCLQMDGWKAGLTELADS